MVGYAFHYKNKIEEMKKQNKKKCGWLELLLKRKFFGVCEEHRELRKSEINIYCIDCSHSMCSHCYSSSSSSSSDHRGHRLLQIRRYVYQDVVRIHDMQKLMDLSKIQSFTVNSAKVVLLNSRKQPRPVKANFGSGLCKVCGRSISDPNNLFCSIACKISEEPLKATISTSHDSEPFISTVTQDLEDLTPKEGESSSSHISLILQSNSLDDDVANDSGVAPKTRKVNHRRKGTPKRSPFF